MEEDNNKVEVDLDVTKKDVKKEFSGFFGSVKHFLKELLEIRHDTNKEGTVQQIKDGISMQGHTAWILVFSITIASIGLNANSAAVVIGAMLISPLMGPILGVGLSIGINDIDTLRKSMMNLGVMIGLSLVTSFLFFSIPLFQEATPEILARVRPDVRDVFIAMAGGLALIVAVSRPSAQTNTVAGVAIATALMPPLCTVGFGLAIGKPLYALGAMYLFTINTIFIALATFLVIKYLRFPMVRYANSKRRRFIARLASLVGLAVMIPAGITFYNVLQESLFRKQAQEFLADTVEIYEFKGNGRYENDLTDVHFDKKAGSYLELAILGTEEVPENIINMWRNKKNTFSRLMDTELRVLHGGRDDSEQKFNYVNELYESKKAELLTKDERIRVLEEEVANLGKYAENSIPFDEITAEAKVNYEHVAGLGFSNRIQTDFNKQDTISLFEVKLKDGLSEEVSNAEMTKISSWLKVRLKDSTIQVNRVE